MQALHTIGVTYFLVMFLVSLLGADYVKFATQDLGQ
jgi:hypothetical protein